jgi:CDGSH-type Zn-finger protein
MENKKTAIFKVEKGGPLEVSGTFTIQGSDGNTIKTEGTILLCRCGESSDKPFCDCTHEKNGFNS